MHALILDDEAAIGRVICRVAQGAGFTAQSATDVTEFQAKFAQAAPDVVFLDLQLGSKDGLGQLRFLADQHYPHAVILMSGFDQRVLAAAERLGRDLGLDILASINKPFRADDLASLFRQLAPNLAAADKNPS